MQREKNIDYKIRIVSGDNLAATEWIRGWKRNNWIKKTDSKPVMNRDLMMKIDELQEQLQLKWVKDFSKFNTQKKNHISIQTYVPGHSSNKGNDEADRLAKAGAQQKQFNLYNYMYMSSSFFLFV